MLRRLYDDVLDLDLRPWRFRSCQVRSTRIELMRIPGVRPRTRFSHSRDGINERVIELGVGL